jgi:hypothetical protein
MMEIEYKADVEFNRFCGRDVRYLSHVVNLNQLTLKYAVGDRERSISARLRNGTNGALRDMARLFGRKARDDAYQLTGDRDRDIADLLRRGRNKALGQ